MPGMNTRLPSPLVSGPTGMGLRNTTVYVGKISGHLTDEFMKQLLGICGEVVKWNRATDPTTKKLVDFGFCEFDTSQGVYRSLKFLGGKRLADKELLVNCDEKNKFSLDVWVRQQRKAHLENLKLAEGKEVKKTSEELDEMIWASNKEPLDKIEQLLDEKNEEYEKSAPDREKEEREREERKKKEKEEEARREKERKERKDVDSDGERKRREARDEDDERRRKLRRLRSNPRQRERENKRRERERQETSEQSRLIREFERKEDRRIRDYKEGMDQLKAPGEREKKRLIEKEIREAKRVKPLSASEDKERKRRVEKERERDEDDALGEARELDEQESKRREEEDRVEEEWRDEEARRARHEKKEETERQERHERRERERKDQEEQERKVREAVAGLSTSTEINQQKQRTTPDLPPGFPMSNVPPPGMPPINIPMASVDLAAEAREAPRQHASLPSFSMTKKPETQSLSLFEAVDEAHRKHAPLQKLENPNDRVNKQKEQDVKTLIAQIPTAKREVFSFPIDWECVRSNNIIDTKLKPWVKKKVIEYLGAEEITMIEFILNKVEAASCGGEGPDHILTELESFIDEEAEGFVLKMWRMIIFENLRVKKT